MAMKFSDALIANLNESNEFGCLCFDLSGNGLIEIARFGKQHEPSIIIVDTSVEREVAVYLIQQHNKVGWEMHGDADGIEYSNIVNVQPIKLVDINDQKKDIDYKEIGATFNLTFTHTV